MPLNVQSFAAESILMLFWRCKGSALQLRGRDFEAAVAHCTALAVSLTRRELTELQRLRREHREAREQLVQLRAEVRALAAGTRAAHQGPPGTTREVKRGFERIIAEQREQIEALQDICELAETS
eukprot:Skav201551  [mRNA]  locus=scaffold1616:272717:274766:+ [translate_table: standard]